MFWNPLTASFDRSDALGKRFPHHWKPYILFLYVLLSCSRLGRVDLGGLGKKCSDFYGLQETLSRNSYMTSGLYRYSLTELADLPPVQHMRGT